MSRAYELCDGRSSIVRCVSR